MGANALDQGRQLQLGNGNPSCSRCGGLMVEERFMDLLDGTGQIEFTAQRCVQCGEVVDPVIAVEPVASCRHCPQKPQQDGDLNRLA